MASATRKTVEKTITEDFVVLELTQEEASALHALIERHGDIDLTEVLMELDAPAEAPEDRPIQVGDKVRILRASHDPSYAGRIGTVGQIDEFDPDAMYRVEFPGDYEWAKSVERVND